MLSALKFLLVAVVLIAFPVGSTVAQDKRTNKLFPIRVNGKTGFINEKGIVVIEPRLDGAYDFSEGLAAAYVGQGQFDEGFIDESGRVAIEPAFNIASRFSEGLAWAGIDPNRKPYKIAGLNVTLYTSPPLDSFDYNIGFIDRSGSWVVGPKFKFAGDFSGGLARVQTEQGKFGFIDKTGKFVIKPVYEWASDFAEGRAVVLAKGRYGYIDDSGKIVIKPRYTFARDFSEGLACVKVGGRVRKYFLGTQIVETSNKNLNFAYIDRSGKIVFRIAAEDCRSFSEGLARFERNGSWGFIEKNGKIKFGIEIDSLGDFSDGLALILLPGKSESFGFIDHTGKVVIRTNYSVVDDFKNGLAGFRMDDPEHGNDITYARDGYIDKSGRVIWAPTR